MQVTSGQDAVLATIDAVARFADRSPSYRTRSIDDSPLSAALWQHSPKMRRFEGHECHILAVSLHGDSHLEQLCEGRSVWRGSAPGSIALLRSTEYSDWRLDGSFEMLHIYLDPTRIPWECGSAKLGRPFRDPVLLQLGHAAAMALRDTEGANRYVMPLLETIQQCLIDRYFTRSALPAGGNGTGLTGFTQRQIDDYVRDHLHADISIEVLADIAGLSCGHFNRAFRASYGVSPHQFLIDRRVARAAELLTQSTQSVAEIANAAGFSSSSHMGSQFKKRMGVSPAAYRRH
mgnify:CR=1 FL=1